MGTSSSVQPKAPLVAPPPRLHLVLQTRPAPCQSPKYHEVVGKEGPPLEGVIKSGIKHYPPVLRPALMRQLEK